MQTCKQANMQTPGETKQYRPSIQSIDFENIRSYRQEKNITQLKDYILDDNRNEIKKNMNPKAFQRMLYYTKMTEDEMLKKCRDDILFCISICVNIAKNASRQGCKDEKLQIDICNSVAKECGVNIEDLSATAFRPTKDGVILSQKEKIEGGISNDCCLKSFDAKITGKMNGWITAKVVNGNGGHQDNVFEEMDTIAAWWETYKSNADDKLVILVDTNLHNKLSRIKEKYTDIKNIIVCNHVELQRYIIDTYYSEEMM